MLFPAEYVSTGDSHSFSPSSLVSERIDSEIENWVQESRGFGKKKKRQEKGGLHSVMAMMVEGMCARTVPESQGRGDRYETCSSDC